MTKRDVLVRAGAVAAMLLLTLAAYLLVLRPWQLRWGATDEEVYRPMPGDELLSSPSFNATRAVTVRARPEEIWPWIVQMGHQRAGFYSYDWFDNGGKPSARRIIPQLQGLEVGDRVPISSMIHNLVAAAEPPRFMVWVSSETPAIGTWTWSLEPIDESHTRLITRLRGSYRWTSPIILLELWVDWGDLPFMRHSMLGIKQRAEGEIIDTYAGDVAEGALWFLSLLVLLAAVILVFRRREWWRPWSVALVTAAVFVAIFYGRPSLWIGALLEAILVAGLTWSYRTTVTLRPAG